MSCRLEVIHYPDHLRIGNDELVYCVCGVELLFVFAGLSHEVVPEVAPLPLPSIESPDEPPEPPHEGSGALPKHSLSKYDGYNLFLFVRGTMHLKSWKNAKRAVGDILDCVLPEFADDLKQLTRAIPCHELLRRSRIRLDIVCMLLRRVEAEMMASNKVDSRVTLSDNVHPHPIPCKAGVRLGDPCAWVGAHFV